MARPDPPLAMVLSFFVPGAGQAYCRAWLRGIPFFLLFVAVFVAAVVTLHPVVAFAVIVVMLAATLDAGLLAKATRRRTA